MNGLQECVEGLVYSAERLPNYAPWTTTLGEAIEACQTAPYHDAKQLEFIRRTFAIHGFTREMTIEDARIHAKG